MMTRILFLLSVFTLVLCGCAGSDSSSGGQSDPKPLKVALLPDESPSTVIANNEKLKEYLQRELSRVVASYRHVCLEGVADRDSLDDAVF
jgi:phosphonate transport system substrate-binding protein